ncbi:DUF378 domain-containing protein [Pediococcus argentinicus]|uniref:DUF378 domain-containing protein n=1 Tax=Pediococcus argentinicus TaxID=480391 RepID=UPI00070C7459|nr:DUF378 domain-containing protein [Pediococcus argentinicus]NKZ22673.1 DUF378 domain-containing protein [Pediococcus argentinicus]GEP19686.1 hypothetical protein LSA03_10700 [Pediococcus argentinicus]
MKKFDVIVLTILILAGLNCLLVGTINLNLIETLVGTQNYSMLKFINIIVGLSALYCLRFIPVLYASPKPTPFYSRKKHY